MQSRIVIAYSLIAVLVMLAAGGIFRLRYNTRRRKMQRYYKAREIAEAEADRADDTRVD